METIAIKGKNIRENELIINEAERKFRKMQQSNQDILILLEQKEATIINLNFNINQDKVEAKKKEEITTAKIVALVNHYKESIKKVIANSKASLAVLKLENKKLKEENLILQMSNKKKINKINKLQLVRKDTQEEEDSDNDKPSTSKVMGHKRDKHVAGERYNDNHKETQVQPNVSENVSPGLLVVDPVSSFLRFSEINIWKI